MQNIANLRSGSVLTVIVTVMSAMDLVLASDLVELMVSVEKLIWFL